MFIIGVSGGSGSGKTRFVTALEDEFGTQLTTISQDDYYKPIEQQDVDAGGIENFDLPRSIDSTQMVIDIDALIQGEEVVRQEYTFNKPESFGKTKIFKPAPVLIVEGLFVLHEPELRRRMNLSIYVDAPDVIKLSRRIRRDGVERGYPVEDVLYRYQNHVLPSYERYIRPYKSRVDLIVNNHPDYSIGLGVITGFIQNRLRKKS